MIVQAGIQGFVTWYRDHGDSRTVATDADSAIAAQVFGAAPRALAGVINLQQTVELVRLTIDVVEENIDELLGHRAGPHRARRAAALRPRARVRDRRGLRPRRRGPRRLGRPPGGPGRRLGAPRRRRHDGALPRRRARLGRPRPGGRGARRGAGRSAPRPSLFDDVRRSARAAGVDALCATQGDRLVVVLGRVEDARARRERGPAPLRRRPGRARTAARRPGRGAPLRRGRPVRRTRAARPGRPPRVPVAADDLLPERALAGDPTPASSWSSRSTCRCCTPGAP